MLKKMAFALLIVILFGLAQNVLAGDSKVAVSPNGQNELSTDGEIVNVVFGETEYAVTFPRIFHIEFMDDVSALLYREDSNVFILALETGRIYYLGEISQPPKFPVGPTPYPRPTISRPSQ